MMGSVMIRRMVHTIGLERSRMSYSRVLAPRMIERISGTTESRITHSRRFMSIVVYGLCITGSL